MKRLLLVITMLSLVELSFGQANSFNWLAIPTPNAAGVAKYGEIPVSYFNGLANISIPLWETNCSDEKIPINLSYHGGGIRVDEHPGVCGLGWDLSNGGVITRKMNNGPDEYVCANTSYGAYKGYYDCATLLNNANWNTPAQLFAYKVNDPIGNNPGFVDDGQPDEFSFSFLNHSGKFFLNENKQWQVISSEDLTFTIEFQFANDYILTDVLNAANYVKLKRIFNSFVITTGDGYKYYFGGDPSTIEFSRGAFNNESMFNGTDVAQFVTPVSWYLTKIVAPDKEIVTYQYERGEPLFEKRKIRKEGRLSSAGGGYDASGPLEMTTGSARNPVYLKKIITPREELNFEYSTSIEKRYINFSTNEDNDQINGINANLLFWRDFESTTGAIPNHEQLLPHKYRQLDQILVKDKTGAVIRKMAFDFDNDMVNPVTTGRRLTLYKLNVTDANNTANSEYKFEYNNVNLLPDYGVRMSDHWGYYNGVDYMGFNSTPYQFDGWRQPDPIKMAYGMLTKIIYPTGGNTEFIYEPHTYSKFINATGNPSTFTYSLSVDNEAADRIAGGLRIKKIISTPFYGGVPVVKEYKYELNNGTSSSGILALKPYYVDVMKTNMPNCPTSCMGIPNGWQPPWTFVEKDDNVSYSPLMFTKGNHVTYSEVKELLSDGGYTKYFYTNHNTPGALDEMSVGMGKEPYTNYSTSYRVSSKEIERGLLISKELYKSTNNLVQKSVYEYINDKSPSTAFSKEISVRIVQTTSALWPCGGTVGGCTVMAGCVWATKLYAYNKLLKKVTETTYETSGPMETYTEYTYDQYRNKITTTTKNSFGKLLVDYIRYNSQVDYQGTATAVSAIAAKKLFTDYKINNYPIEQLTMLKPNMPIVGADKIIGGNLFQYDLNGKLATIHQLELTEPVIPVTYNSSLQPTYHFTYSKIENGTFIFDSRYKVQTKVNKFTVYPIGLPNRPASITVDNKTSVYTWDYNAQYQSSATQNAELPEVAFCGFEGSYLDLGNSDNNRGNWDFTHYYIVNNGFTGNKSLDISMGSIISLNSLTSGKNYYVSFWAQGSGYPQLKLGTTLINQMYMPVKTVGNWKLYRIKVLGDGTRLSIVPSAGLGVSLLIDEVRLYPESALMKSYNYNPSTRNIVSVSDEAENVTFYFYDGLGRLTYAKDEKGNILKNYIYQTQGN